MSFSTDFARLLNEPSPTLRQFIRLIDTVSDEQLEAMAQESARLTKKHYGNTMRLFAPIYLSNECVNNCVYCGFSRNNPIRRTTLTVDELIQEARYLYDKGHRSILLVAGEHPKFVSDGYIQECLDALKTFIPSLSLEIGPLPDNTYSEIVSHGAEGLIVYQETYDQAIYETLHTSGPKKDFAWRLDCPERAYAGGFRRLGIGALFGLREWREEAIALACHLDYLLKTCWKAQITCSFPRMRPYSGNYEYEPDPERSLNDRNFIQLICALRICFPQIGIVVSTRESSDFRNNLMGLGMTHLSAEAKTEPGGYTGAGKDHIHQTIRGRCIDVDSEEKDLGATEQFAISDDRSVEEIREALLAKGFEPVWKDWDFALMQDN